MSSSLMILINWTYWHIQVPHYFITFIIYMDKNQIKLMKFELQVIAINWILMCYVEYKIDFGTNVYCVFILPVDYTC